MLFWMKHGKQAPGGLLAHPPAAGLCSDFAALLIPAAVPLRTWIRRPLTCLLDAGPSLTDFLLDNISTKNIWQDLWGCCCQLWTVESKKCPF